MAQARHSGSVAASPALELVPWASERRPFLVADEQPSLTTGGSPETAASTREGDSIVLRWPKVDGADYYDVVLWRDGRRIADLWPRTNRLTVDGEMAPNGQPLVPGTYGWFAYGAFRRADSTRFGPAVGRGEFRIPSR